jgi:hypothetical protein
MRRREIDGRPVAGWRISANAHRCIACGLSGDGSEQGSSRLCRQNRPLSLAGGYGLLNGLAIMAELGGSSSTHDDR